VAKFVILDTETTGTDEKDRIIQLGYMVLEPKKEIEIYNEFCFTDVPISYGAMEVHHITPEVIEGKMPCVQTEAYRKLNQLNTPDNYMIIHNAPFDLGMLLKEGFECKRILIDTLRCARHVYDEEEAHRLQFFRYKMGLYKDEHKEAERLGIEIKAHDAIGDVLVLKLFLTKLRERVEQKFPKANPIDKMVELTSEPVFIKQPLRFGKHKGKTLTEIAEKDSSYLRWMLTGMENLDEDMKYSIEKVLTV
jgi:DNA polymerase-3 subunit epsilon/exodeoxyribonuclease X